VRPVHPLPSIGSPCQAVGVLFEHDGAGRPSVLRPRRHHTTSDERSCEHAGHDTQVRAEVGTGEALGLLVDAVREYAIFMLDPEGRIVTWNAGARRIKGYSAEEIIGRHFSVFYVPEEVNAAKPQRELAVALAEGQSRDEGWRVRKDGSRFWANVVITAVVDGHGSHQGFARSLGTRRTAGRPTSRSGCSSFCPSGTGSPISCWTLSSTAYSAPDLL
jgi:PAS domain S-box-containing protein